MVSPIKRAALRGEPADLGGMFGWIVSIQLWMVIMINLSFGHRPVIFSVVFALIMVVGPVLAGYVVRANARSLLVTAMMVWLYACALRMADSKQTFNFLVFAIAQIAVVWAAAQVSDRGRSIFYHNIIAISVVQSLVATSQYFTGSPSWGGYLLTGGPGVYALNHLTGADPGRTIGTVGHAIPAALTCFYGLVVLLTRRELRIPAWLRPLLALVCVFGVVTTGTRSMVIVGVVVIGYLVFFQRTVLGGWYSRTVILGASFIALIYVNIGSLSIFTSLEDTPSLTVRVGSLQVLTGILHQPALDWLMGFGWTPAQRLSDKGLMSLTLTGAIDNNFVTSVAVGGVIYLAMLLLLLLLGFRAGDATTRGIMLASAGMFMSYDVTVWSSSAAVLFAFAALPAARAPHRRFSRNRLTSHSTRVSASRRVPVPARVSRADHRAAG